MGNLHEGVYGEEQYNYEIVFQNPKTLRDAIKRGDLDVNAEHCGLGGMETPLETVILSRILSKSEKVEALRVLLENGANVRVVRRVFKYTLLHTAVNMIEQNSMTEEDFEILRLLINYGVDKNAVDEDGQTALFIAAIMCKSTDPLDLLKFLIEQNVDTTISPKDYFLKWDDEISETQKAEMKIFVDEFHSLELKEPSED